MADVPFILTCLFGLLALMMIYGGNLNYDTRIFSFPRGLGAYVSTALSIGFLLRVSRILSRALGSGSLLWKLSDASLDVMCHHMFAVAILNKGYTFAARVLAGFGMPDAFVELDGRWYFDRVGNVGVRGSRATG